MIDESKLKTKKASHEKRRVELTRELEPLKHDRDFQIYARGKAVFEKVESLERELRAADSAVSLIDSQLTDIRAANADPALHEAIVELYDDRVKTYASETSKELTNWLGASVIVTNRAAVEARVQAIDNAIRQIRELQRSPEPIDVEIELAKIQRAIPSTATLSKTEKIAAVAEARA